MRLHTDWLTDAYAKQDYTNIYMYIYWMIYEPVWLVKHLCEMGCPET